MIKKNEKTKMIKVIKDFNHSWVKNKMLCNKKVSLLREWV